MHLHHDTALVVLSGGQDSTTCLYMAKATHSEVHAITFDYGQRHAAELGAAALIGQLADVASHEIIHLPRDILHSVSPLVSHNKLEQYKDFRSLPGGIEKTFVPMRNQLFLTLAANRAVEVGARYIYTGVCEEDYGGYPDCRRVFIEALEHATDLGLASVHHVQFCTPLMNLTKSATVLRALLMPGCYEALAFSHTAYDGQYPPTGHDHASLLRAKGFAEAGVPDPLVLRAWLEDKMELPDEFNYLPDVRAPYTPRVQKIIDHVKRTESHV